MFEHDCLDTCCFGCLICMCYIFCTCTGSAQLSMFHMRRRCRNAIITIIIKARSYVCLLCACTRGHDSLSAFCVHARLCMRDHGSVDALVRVCMRMCVCAHLYLV